MTVYQAALTGVVVAGIASGQILFKLAADSISSNNFASMFRALVVSPYFVAAIVVYGGMTVLWLGVLQRVPLSQAYPFFALTFLLVPLFSALFLSESLHTTTLIGSAMIVGGVVVATANATG